MSVVNSAFHVIRTARNIPSHGLPRKPKLVEKVDFGNGVQGNVYEIEAIVTPYPSPWRHPIYWWKMRHLRADIRYMEKEVGLDPLPRHMRRVVEEAENEAFLRGTEAL